MSRADSERKQLIQVAIGTQNLSLAALMKDFDDKRRYNYHFLSLSDLPISYASYTKNIFTHKIQKTYPFIREKEARDRAQVIIAPEIVDPNL